MPMRMPREGKDEWMVEYGLRGLGYSANEAAEIRRLAVDPLALRIAVGARKRAL